MWEPAFCNSRSTLADDASRHVMSGLLDYLICDCCLVVCSTGGNTVLKAAGSQVEAARK